MDISHFEEFTRNLYIQRANRPVGTNRASTTNKNRHGSTQKNVQRPKLFQSVMKKTNASKRKVEKSKKKDSNNAGKKCGQLSMKGAQVKC